MNERMSAMTGSGMVMNDVIVFTRNPPRLRTNDDMLVDRAVLGGIIASQDARGEAISRHHLVYESVEPRRAPTLDDNDDQ